MKKYFKIISLFFVALFTVVLLCSCFNVTPRRKIVISTLGEYEKEEFYSSGVFQDYTDYGKYYFSGVPSIKDNEYFKFVAETDIVVLNGYIDNFDNWVNLISESPSTKEGRELVKNYDLDRTIINEGDFFYIYDKMGEPIGESQYEQYECYDVYIFDIESCTLYYFHNNI
ncbi:MAG: hypothetical protein IJA82_05685 [Clostridia bacterium]|nr:hypothetical protein [Clostridia bacterium]